MHLTQALRRAAQLKPDGVAIISRDRRLTYSELQERAGRCATVLRGLGVRLGDRVALLSDSTDRSLEIFFGAWWAGAMIVPLNPQWRSEEIAHALDACEARVLLTDRPVAGRPSTGGGPGQQAVLHIDVEAGWGATASYLQRIQEASVGAAEELGFDTPAGIVFTGGATASPKGVVLSHGGLYVNALAGLAEGLSDQNARFLLTTPLHAAGGVFFMLMQVVAAGVTIMAAGLSARDTAGLIERERASHAGLSPSMVAALVDQAELDRVNLASLRCVVYGGSPLDEAVLSRARLRLPGVALIQTYGLTELGPLAATLPAWRHGREGRVGGKLRSAGRAAPHVELRILDAAGRAAPLGSIGQIAGRGAGVMLGYWRRPDLTADAIQDGWLRTGDFGSMDEDGYLYLVARALHARGRDAESMAASDDEAALSPDSKLPA